MTTPATPLPRRTPAEVVRRAQLADGATYGFAGALPLDWISHSGASVADTLIAWERGDLADLPAGRSWDIVTLPRRAGWDTVFHLRSSGITLGPVLNAREVHYFVAPRSADGWDLPDGELLPAGTLVAVPHPSFVAPRTLEARTWIVPPKGGGCLTDGGDLYRAYAAALVSPAETLGGAS